MNDDVLLAASNFSRVSGIPLSKVIAFAEGFSAKQERKIERYEANASTYSERAAKEISNRIRRQHENMLLDMDYESEFTIPKSVMDAYLDAKSG